MSAPDQQLFTVEEAFVRLGQTRGRGCLLCFNNYESAHLFVEDGFVVCAISSGTHGEAALSYALHMDNSAYVWMNEVNPLIKNLKLDIQAYSLKHSVARDIHIGKTMSLKKPTSPIAQTDMLAKAEKKELRLDFIYVLNPEDNAAKIKLVKMTNVVGRDDHCDIVLDNSQVSRRHCLIQVTARGLLVKDLDSTNGTYANGRAMTDGYINSGDTLGLGSYVLKVGTEKQLSYH